MSPPDPVLKLVRTVIHHRFHHWLVGAVLVSVTVLNVTRPALAQASSRAPKVIYFSRPETADALNDDSVRESVEQPQRSTGTHDAMVFKGGHGLGETENSNDFLPRPSRPVVIRFGQSTRSNTRQAAGALDSVDARPVHPRPVDARFMGPRPTVGDGPLLVPQYETDLRVAADAPPRTLPGDLANASKLETNASAIAAESAVAGLDGSEVSQRLTEAANVRATSLSVWKPTAESRQAPHHRVVKFVATTPAPAEAAETTQSTIEEGNGLDTAESDVDPATVARSGELLSGVSPNSRLGRFQKQGVKEVGVQNSDPSSSAGTIPNAPTALLRIDHVMVALIGGFVLLMCVLFCMLIFMLTMVGRRREPMVKVDIHNNGTGMAGGMPAYSQTVTMNDSQAVDHTDSQHRTPAHSQPVAPAYSHPVTHQYSQPNPYGDSRFGMPASSQPTVPTYSQPAAPVYTRPTVQAYKPPDQAFTPSAAPANSYPATQPTLRTAPVQATNRQRDEVLQQNQQDGAVARQVFEQNLELREKLRSSQKRVA